MEAGALISVQKIISGVAMFALSWSGLGARLVPGARSGAGLVSRASRIVPRVRMRVRQWAPGGEGMSGQTGEREGVSERLGAPERQSQGEGGRENDSQSARESVSGARTERHRVGNHFLLVFYFY